MYQAGYAGQLVGGTVEEQLTEDLQIKAVKFSESLWPGAGLCQMPIGRLAFPGDSNITGCSHLLDKWLYAMGESGASRMRSAR
jgi:hypothetical protein